MIYSPRDFVMNTGLNRLIPVTGGKSLVTLDQEGERLGSWGYYSYGPRVLHGSEVKKCIEAVNGYDGDQLDVQPCSADVLLNDFYRIDGTRLQYPFSILPNEKIIGKSGLRYAGRQDAYVFDGTYIERSALCVETKSKIARRGLVCKGFYDGKAKNLLLGSGNLNFLLQNHSSNKLLVPRPFSPVQICITEDSDKPFGASQLKIMRGDEDTTDQSSVKLGYGLTAYITTLSNELVYFKRQDKPVDILGDEFEALAVRTNIDEMPDDIDFCLTMTEERVQTNGSPVFMMPFHHKDAIDNSPHFLNTYYSARLFSRIFEDTNFMPVTGNAGLLNPGSNTRVVCENITKGRDFKKYFQKGAPFACVVPVPFADYSVDVETYQGLGVLQKRIIF